MKEAIIKKAAAAALASMLLLTGCARSTAEQTGSLKADNNVKTELKLEEVANKKYDENKLNSEYGRYSFKLMAEITSKAGENSNIMISPASIMIALDMVAAGAKGETLKQMNELFAKDTDPLEQQAFASELMKRINASQKIKFVCANAIWNDEKVLGGKINPTYTEYIKKMFKADFNSVNFNANTHKEINKWVDGKTDHMIPELFDQPFEPNIVMVLVNAICFEAQWQKGYQPGQITQLTFNGTEKQNKTSMLSGTENGYFETDKATGFIKYYEGEEYAFITILPKDTKANANDFLKSFTYDDYRKFIESRSSEDVRTIMPEFKSDYGAELNGPLKNLGVTLAFDDAKADLTGIAEPKEGNLYITQVIHKTHIEVDRKGTKAAAATGIKIGVKSAMPVRDMKEVICDRPFAYAIVDAKTMNPVFIGTVNNAG